MSNPRILEAWRELLPPDVAISAGPLLDDAPALTPREEASAGAMDAGRTLEFKTGRAYAKLALSKLGFHNVDLPVGADRAPIWPAGVSGSITHAAGPRADMSPWRWREPTPSVASGSTPKSIAPCIPPHGLSFWPMNELQNVRDLPMEFRAGHRPDHLVCEGGGDEGAGRTDRSHGRCGSARTDPHP